MANPIEDVRNQLNSLQATIDRLASSNFVSSPSSEQTNNSTPVPSPSPAFSSSFFERRSYRSSEPVASSSGLGSKFQGFRSRAFNNKASVSAPKKKTPFCRTVTLLPNCHQHIPLTLRERNIIEFNKLEVQSVEFYREMSAVDVLDKIRQIFSAKLSNDVKLEFVRFNGQFFSSFNPEPGTSIDGAFLLRNTKSNFYVRPSVNIAVDVAEQTTDESDGETFVPKKRAKKATTKFPKDYFLNFEDTDSNSEDDVCPAKKETKKFVFVDEDGTEYLLQDVDKNDVNVINDVETKVSLSELSRRLKTKQQGIVYLYVHRPNVLEEFEANLPSNFSVLSKLSVTFIGERGVDCGGLTRELLTLLLFRMKEDRTLFEGEDNCKTLTLNCKSLKNGRYRLVGQVLQLSFLNNGPSPRFFSPHLFDLMSNKTLVRDELTCDIVKNANLVEQLNQLKNCTSANQIKALLASDLHEFCVWGGADHCVSQENFEEEKNDIIKGVIEQYAISRIAKPLEQLKQGLTEETNFLQEIQKDPSSFKEFFCFNVGTELSARDFLSLFKVTPITDDEKRVSKWWEKFVQEVEAKNSSVTLSELLAWITGCSTLPAVAFDKQPRINFKSGEVPRVAECANTLHLPLESPKYSDFKTTLQNCVKCKEFSFM